jgi:Cof subfamily protein (haloacid dehalogenase superfamily)
MPVRMLAFDIDDTIYEWPNEVSSANRRALALAQEAGIVVCIATARHVASAEDFMGKAGIRGPLIANSGATVRLQPGGPIVTRAAMSREACLPIAEFADALDVMLWITLADGHTYVRDDSPRTDASIALEVHPVATNVEGMRGDPVRIIAAGMGGEMIFERLADRGDGQFSLCRTVRGGQFVGLAITALDATKEAALGDVCGELGISLSDVLAMGDGESDAGMIRLAGLGVAPANADPAALAAADVVAPRCADDAVAWVIEKYCGLA